ncbi:MAG TPA: protoporphyrinogen oxidase [Vicinamibacterales bacterium]|jgi:oxygen-dependent protoporphyrinogen oxidase|nr:protoporphyrinogen oxidase [Vicinamibacterales bacterium]
MDPNSPGADVVIVGGGIAGLAAAYELAQRRVPCVLLERSSRAGGVIVSEQVDGYTIDGGPDALLVQKPDGIALCQQLGLGDRLVPTKLPRLAYIQRAGRLHALPAGSVLGVPTRVSPFLRTALFSWPGKLRMGAELFVPAKRDDADESIGAFMTRRFGAEATTYLAEPLLAGIHAGDVNRLSMPALFPRFVDDERKYGSLLRAFRQRAAPASADGAFRSLPGGLSELVGALVASLPAGVVRLGSGVSRVSGSGSGPFHVETDGHETFHARAVIVATPAYATASMLRDYDAEIARLCGEIPYASAGTVVIAFRREDVGHPLNGSGFVVPQVEANGILAASWLSSKWPGRAPEGRVLLRAFVGGARDPDALEHSDAQLVTRAMDALTPLLDIRAQPTFSRVYRFTRANAQHEVGHLARIAALDRALARHPGLFLTGSGLRGVGIPDCIADSRATARQVTEWLTSVA